MPDAMSLPAMDHLLLKEMAYNQWHGQRAVLPMPSHIPSSTDEPLAATAVDQQFKGPNSYRTTSLNLQRNVYLPFDMESKFNMPLQQQIYPPLKRPYQTLDHSPNENNLNKWEEGPDSDNPSTSPSNIDRRLLSFGRLPDRYTVVDSHGRGRMINISAQIQGMFLLSEESITSNDGMVQPELTCYRRNMFQVSGCITGPTGSLSVLCERGEAIPIVSQALSVSAIESVDNHNIHLIVIPWKKPQPDPQEVPPEHGQEPLPIPLFHLNNGRQDVDNDDIAVQPIIWSRLQFRVATANNGRRKELQQYFKIRLTLTATLATGGKVNIIECTTAPIVVRGRSPRDFQSRKEIPLGGSGWISRARHLQSSGNDGCLSSLAGVPRILLPTDLEPSKIPSHHDTDKFSNTPVTLQNSYSQWNGSQQQGQYLVTSASSSPDTCLPDANPPLYPQIISSHMQEASSQAAIDHCHIPTADDRRLYNYPPGPLGASIPQQYIDNNPRPARAQHIQKLEFNSPETFSEGGNCLGAFYQVDYASQQNIASRGCFPAVLPWGSLMAPGPGSDAYQAYVLPPPSQQNLTLSSEHHAKDESQRNCYPWGTD